MMYEDQPMGHGLEAATEEFERAKFAVMKGEGATTEQAKAEPKSLRGDVSTYEVRAEDIKQLSAQEVANQFAAWMGEAESSLKEMLVAHMALSTRISNAAQGDDWEKVHRLVPEHQESNKEVVAALRALAGEVSTADAKQKLVAAAGDVGEHGKSLDEAADALLLRVAAFFGECVGSGPDFCGLGIDEERDEEGKLLSLRLVACDLVNDQPVRRVAR